MSIKVMSAIWEDLEVKQQSDLLVILAIADFADDKGLAWPSIASLAKKSRQSERNVHYALKRLEDARKLAITKISGRHQPNLFRVILGKSGVQGLHPSNGLWVQVATVRGAKNDVEGCKAFAPDPSGSVSDPSHTQPGVQGLHPSPPVNGDLCARAFERFWAAYPKKTARFDAEHAFVEVKASDHLTAILAAVESQRHSPDWTREGGRYIPMPANWLRDGRWQDSTEVLKPESYASKELRKIANLNL